MAVALAALLAATSGCAQRPAGAASSPVATASAAPAASPAPTATPEPVPTAALPDRPLHVAAVGDSLSTGFDACSRYGDCPEASWVTGTNPTVASIADRLRASTGEEVAVTNVARAGAVVADLPAQVERAVAAQPSIVTVLVGGNDVCRATTDAMTSEETYAAIVDEQLRALSAGVPDAVLLVASVPDVTKLLNAAAGDETARFLWSNMGGCATALDDPRSVLPDDTVRRELVRERTRAYNAALERTCAALPRCLYDGGALYAYQPTIAQLSALDAFHPSVAGLRELAATEWAVLAAGLGDLAAA